MRHRIVPFEPSTAPRHLAEGLFDFEDRLFRELEAVDPLPLRESRRESMRDTNPRRNAFRWVVLGDVDGKEEVIGKGSSLAPAEILHSAALRSE